jgi:phospholipid/cholesterol/gamma-HCH transport system substrate-binding protein
METKAHYALVGFFAIALVAATALFAVWLGQLRFSQTYNEYDIVFQGPIRGLEEASEVRFSGIKVGEVTRLRLDPDNSSNVIAHIRISSDTQVTDDSVAQLEPQGITGLNYIQLNATSSPCGANKFVPEPGEVPRIASCPAQLDTLIASSEDIARRANEALSKINDVLDEETVADLSDTIANIRRITGQLAGDDQTSLTQRILATLSDIDKAVGDISRFATDADALLSSDVKPLVADVRSTSEEVRGAAAEARGLLEDAHEPVTRATDDLALAIGDLRRVLNELEIIAAGVEDDPAGFVTGGRRFSPRGACRCCRKPGLRRRSIGLMAARPRRCAPRPPKASRRGRT